MRPENFQAIGGGRELLITWRPGSESRIAAPLLWAECPSAQARRRRLDGRQGHPSPDLTIRSVTPIGHYAVNIAFSDGHDRGIYPWALLAALARRPTVEDFIGPADEH
jgi:DUF971 family protein